MKNLANCKPSEFLVQSNKIRKSVSRWLTDTDIMGIRKRLPSIPAEATDEERKALLQEQAKQNLSDILDSVLDEHPKETLEVLALCCFVEPEHVDDYPMMDYLQAFQEIIENETVISFFTSLMAWGNRLT